MFKKEMHYHDERRAAALLQGGLAGLLLRLRQDGHGELAAFGPAGIAAHAAALRHLVRWRHPALKVCELDPLDPPVVYQVGHCSHCKFPDAAPCLLCSQPCTRCSARCANSGATSPLGKPCSLAVRRMRGWQWRRCGSLPCCGRLLRG